MGNKEPAEIIIKWLRGIQKRSWINVGHLYKTRFEFNYESSENMIVLLEYCDFSLMNSAK